MHLPSLILSSLLSLPASILVLAIAIPEPLPLSPDPAGLKNIGNGHGTQFIGGACLSQADCASACCATLAGAGICSGPGAQFQAGKQGCGFGGGGSGSSAGGGGGGGGSTITPPITTPPNNGPPSSPNGDGGGVPIDTSIPGSSSVGKANAQQFITGQCISNADCASGCCAGLPTANKGAQFAVCSGPAVGNQAGKTGCGFTIHNTTPNLPPVSAPPPPPLPLDPASKPAGSGGFFVDSSIPGSASVGRADGRQFITGQCRSNADCASGCCAGLPSAGNGVGFAVCSGPAVGNVAGKTGCGFRI